MQKNYQKNNEFFKNLYEKPDDTGALYYLDEQDEERTAQCDPLFLKSVTFLLEGGPPECEFMFLYGNDMITRSFAPDDFLHHTNGRYPLIKKLAALGFYLRNVSEHELIAYIKEKYGELRKTPYYSSKFRGWVRHNGKKLFIADKIYGGNHLSSPKMNPAYQSKPYGDLNVFLATIDTHVNGWHPSEMALGLALGSSLLGYNQEKLPSFSGACGYVASTSLGKTVNLEFSTSVFANPCYGREFDTATYDDVVLPATHNANCTTNYLFGGIDKDNGIFMQIDDLTAGVIDDHEHVLYQLSHGEEKGRATKQGNPAKRNKFCTFFGLSSEKSLITPETNGGVFARYLELKLTSFCRNAAHADALSEVARRHHSLLGPAYVLHLMELLKIDPTAADTLVEKYYTQILEELDQLQIENKQSLGVMKRLAKLFRYVPASLALFNHFFATGDNAKCKAIDIDSFIEWLTLRISENTIEAALSYNHLLQVENLRNFIKENFYGQFESKDFNKFFKSSKTYSLLSNMKDFDTAEQFDVFSNKGERIGFKKEGRIVIKAQYFKFAYNHYIEIHNKNYPSKKITLSLIQFLKQLKLHGILSHEVGRNTCRDFVFGHNENGPIKPLCYAFKMDVNAPEQWGDEDAEPIEPPDFSEIDGVKMTSTCDIEYSLGGKL